ncbi:MAG: radical SAM protein [Deltaproteobacteria bacterium]|nr:radical SAM protein [Deltaproteobacteria bacterium]
MKYVFGPVRSRRLGRSLGVDPVPLKTCNWNCVYCQLGRSRPMVATREAWVPAEDVVAEVRQTLEARGDGIDWITFAGSGEPTLHAQLGWMLASVKEMTEIPVAVITNGVLLHDPEVRAALRGVDAVLPSLDAGTDALYRKVVRPHPEATFERLVQGLTAFRQEFTGYLWVETMLIRGLNDDEAALEQLAHVLEPIAPNEIHLNVTVRPPSEPWVAPPEAAALDRAAEILGRVAPVVVPSGRGVFVLDEGRDPVEQILEVIERHPLPERVLSEGLAHLGEATRAALFAQLEATGRAQRVERQGEPSWVARSAFFS